MFVLRGKEREEMVFDFLIFCFWKTFLPKDFPSLSKNFLAKLFNPG
jgi:hypothetical protein